MGITTDMDAAGLISLVAETSGGFTGEPAGDIRVIYEALEQVDPGIRESLLSGGDRKIRSSFCHALFTDEKSAFRKYCEDPQKGRYAEGYLECILSIYEGYKKNPPDGMGIDELAERTAELVMHGMNGAR